MTSYLDIVCKDIRNEINKYLIPSPPCYKENYIIRRIHVVDTSTGELIVSVFSGRTAQEFFNTYSSKGIYRKQYSPNDLIHTCMHKA